MTTYFILTMIFGGNGTDFSEVAEYTTLERCQAAYAVNVKVAQRSHLRMFGSCTPK